MGESRASPCAELEASSMVSFVPVATYLQKPSHILHQNGAYFQDSFLVIRITGICGCVCVQASAMSAEDMGSLEDEVTDSYSRSLMGAWEPNSVLLQVPLPPRHLSSPITFFFKIVLKGKRGEKNIYKQAKMNAQNRNSDRENHKQVSAEVGAMSTWSHVTQCWMGGRQASKVTLVGQRARKPHCQGTSRPAMSQGLAQLLPAVPIQSSNVTSAQSSPGYHSCQPTDPLALCSLTPVSGHSLSCLPNATSLGTALFLRHCHLYVSPWVREQARSPTPNAPMPGMELVHLRRAAQLLSVWGMRHHCLSQ